MKQQTAPVSTAIVFVLALNLRPAVTSLGAALEDVSLAPGMTAAVGAVLVALPLWASGLGGWITPWLRARIGIHRAVSWALVILGISLVVRVQNGAELLIAGTALACLAIAVVGTVLPVLVQPASSRTKASFTLALGTGSTIGALVTPTLVAASSWQFALAGWALLALVTVHVWQRAPRSSMVFVARSLSPRQLFHSRVAWHLTFYFGLVSTLTFLIMGWLPAILRDAGISASYAGFCLALSMAMGLPMMWLVPFGVHRMRRPGILVVLLAALNGVGVVGLLVAPAVMPWLWSTGLGLGMGGLAMALTTISVRAGQNPDITTALSGMVQGLGYFIAGAGALACGLVHSATGSWDLPLIIALVVLGGQVWCGLRAARPIVIAPRAIGELESVKPKPDLTRRNIKPAWTGQPMTNGTRVTAKSEWGPVAPDLAHSANGTRVTAVSEPKPATNGVRVTAMADQAPGPDVTQPISGVWVAAIADLESIKSDTNLTLLPNGLGIFADADLERLANGAQLAALSGPRPAKPEQDMTHLVNGVRVTALAESEADTAKPTNGVPVGAVSEPERSDLAPLANGVRVTAMSTPVKRERVLPHLVNGVWIAGPAESELAAAALAECVPVAASAEPDLAHLTNGVRVTAVSESERDMAHLVSNGVRFTAVSGSDASDVADGVRVAAGAKPDIWGPELVDLPNGVWVRSTVAPEHLFNGVRVAASSRPDSAESERDVTRLMSNGVPVTGSAESEPDSGELADGVRVAGVSELESVESGQDTGYVVNGVRVTASVESASKPETEVVDLPNGVWVRVKAGSDHLSNGVRVTGPAESEPDATDVPDGVRVQPDLAPPANGVPVEVELEHLANAAPVTGAPESERDLAQPLNNGVRVTAETEPVRSKPDLTRLTNGVWLRAKIDPGRFTDGVRITRVPNSEPAVPEQPDYSHLSGEGRGIALAEATIPLPRKPNGPLAGPPAGPPVGPAIHSETATQEG